MCINSSQICNFGGWPYRQWCSAVELLSGECTLRAAGVNAAVLVCLCELGSLETGQGKAADSRRTKKGS